MKKDKRFERLRKYPLGVQEMNIQKNINPFSLYGQADKEAEQQFLRRQKGMSIAQDRLYGGNQHEMMTGDVGVKNINAMDTDYISGQGYEKGTSGVKPFGNNADYNKYLREAASYLGIDPQWLDDIIVHESGRNPHAFNKKEEKEHGEGRGASGLIQFMPNTAKGLGTSTLDIRKMGMEEQFNLIKKFYSPYKGKYTSRNSLGMATFLPKYLEAAPDTVIDKKWVIGKDKAGNPYVVNPVFKTEDGKPIDVLKNPEQATVRNYYNHLNHRFGSDGGGGGGGSVDTSIPVYDEKVNKDFESLRKMAMKEGNTTSHDYLGESLRKMTRKGGNAISLSNDDYLRNLGDGRKSEDFESKKVVDDLNKEKPTYKRGAKALNKLRK